MPGKNYVANFRWGNSALLGADADRRATAAPSSHHPRTPTSIRILNISLEWRDFVPFVRSVAELLRCSE